jgi:hypothetical protein
MAVRTPYGRASTTRLPTNPVTRRCPTWPTVEPALLRN